MRRECFHCRPLVLGPLSAQEGRAVMTIISSEPGEKLPPMGYRSWVYFSYSAHKSQPRLIDPKAVQEALGAPVATRLHDPGRNLIQEASVSSPLNSGFNLPLLQSPWINGNNPQHS